MQKVLSESSQRTLLEAISDWQSKEGHQFELERSDLAVFIETITFTPYYNGKVTAIVSYRVADSSNVKIAVNEVQPSFGATSERSVFSAMQGGTDGG
jgi:hypothetical protein